MLPENIFFRFFAIQNRYLFNDFRILIPFLERTFLKNFISKKYYWFSWIANVLLKNITKIWCQINKKDIEDLFRFWYVSNWKTSKTVDFFNLYKLVNKGRLICLDNICLFMKKVDMGNKSMRHQLNDTNSEAGKYLTIYTILFEKRQTIHYSFFRINSIIFLFLIFVSRFR